MLKKNQSGAEKAKAREQEKAAIRKREGDQLRGRLQAMRADHAAKRHGGAPCDGSCER